MSDVIPDHVIVSHVIESHVTSELGLLIINCQKTYNIFSIDCMYLPKAERQKQKPALPK